MEASSSTTSTDCVLLLIPVSLGATGGGQRERQRERRDQVVVAAVDGVRAVVVGGGAVHYAARLAQEGQVGAPASHAPLNRPADVPKADPFAAPDRRRVGLVLRPLVPADDRAGAIAVNRVVDHHASLGNAA